jgi:hypothetical protein
MVSRPQIRFKGPAKREDGVLKPLLNRTMKDLQLSNWVYLIGWTIKIP